MDIMLQRILELMPTKHGSKKELAEAVGFPANLVAEWKSGRNKSYPKYAAKIADYYDVSLDWLSGKTDIKKDAASISADDIREVIEFKELMNQLPEEKQLELLRYARYLVEQNPID